MISREVFAAAKAGKKIMCLGLGKPREAWLSCIDMILCWVDTADCVPHGALLDYDWRIIEPKIEITESQFEEAWSKTVCGKYTCCPEGMKDLKKELGFL